MSYTKNVTVPRITAAMVAEFEAKAPGLSAFVKIPVVTEPHEAWKAAEAMANKTLPRYEYVSKVESITETATGWIVTMKIAGD